MSIFLSEASFLFIISDYIPMSVWASFFYFRLLFSVPEFMRNEIKSEHRQLRQQRCECSQSLLSKYNNIEWTKTAKDHI